MMWINSTMVTDQSAKSGRVESRPRPQHSAGWNSNFGCESRGQMRHYVHGICRNDDNGVRRMGKHGRHHFTENAGITLKQLQPRFAGLLSDTGAQHDYAAPGKMFVITRADIEGMSERHGMPNVIGLRVRALDVLIYENNLTPDALHDHRIRRGGADKTTTDDSNFHCVTLI
jgi:hypothetical protein